MRGKGLAASRAVGALILTFALVVGVPYLLVALVGNPLPGELPSIDEIRILLTQNGEGFAKFIMGTLAILIWVIWAQLMLALVVEAVATIGHAETRRLRTAPGIQSFAARLVATITLATTLAALPGLAPAVGALTFDDAISTMAPTTVLLKNEMARPFSMAPPGGPNAVTSSPDHADQAVASLVVRDHTELWDLADAAYGDGVSWKLIALANAGLTDAAGNMITNESETVAAGTELVLPGEINGDAASAFGAFASDEPGATSTELEHTVEDGDSMWTVAETEVERRLDRTATTSEIAEFWVDVVEANPAVSSGNADLIYPGERLVFPGEVAVSSIVHNDAPTEQASPPIVPEFEIVESPSGNRNTVTARIEHAQFEVHPDTDSAAPGAFGSGAAQSPEISTDLEARFASYRHVSLPALGLAALGAGIFSGGVVGVIRRRRDLQRRTRPSGAIARPPSTEAAAFEAAMIHASHELRQSHNGLGWKILPAATVNAMRAAGSTQTASAEATFDQAAALEPRRIDVTEPLAPREQRNGAEGTVAPTSIIVGTDPTNNEAVFINLEAAGAVALRGDDAAIRRFARSVVLDLAVSDRADDLCVIAVGAGSELQDLERVRFVATFADALTQAVRCGHATTESATPVVVVSELAVGDADDVAQALRDLGALVVAPGLDTPVSVTIADDSAILMPSGSTVMIAALDDDAYRSVAELIDSTSSTSIELPDPSVPVEDIIDITATSDCAVAAGPIDVKILGPVEVTGAESFSSLKAVDVVAYLAFHRHGVDADQIKTWVWPAFEPPTDKAFANVMSRARTGLGANADGTPYLSRAGADKTYRLADEVTTDFDRFRAVVGLADEATETTAMLALLGQALELIRGIPFTGGAASSFAWADNHVRARVEYTIDETVHRCADLALEIGDLATARWAALKGLELVPGCEQCFKRRFLVAGAGNNRSELRRAMADLEASAMVDLGEPEAVDTISGELLDLYHELDRALITGSAGARS